MIDVDDRHDRNLLGTRRQREFIPRLAKLNAEGRCPFHELIATFPISAIYEAEVASASGAVIKPVLLFD